MQHLTVGVLREGFRRLREFRALYEETGQDVLVTDDGQSLCLWDLEYLYDQRSALTKRQREAIECLAEDLSERETALRMGVAAPESASSAKRNGQRRNPVTKYATDGLRRLLERHEERLAA